MKIRITSVPVDDQEKALLFYTETLGFSKKMDVPAGEYRWLTVVSPDDENEVELLLEPMGFPPTKMYQQELYNAGIPFTSFTVDNMQDEYRKLKSRGVVFTSEPEKVGPVIMAVIDDTCGNLIQLVQR